MNTKNVDKKRNKRIEKFKKLCCAGQGELKAKLKCVLQSMGYKDVNDEDGFLYAKGEIPVLLVAHMDTVHKVSPVVISIEEKEGETILSSPFGIGGDDRCGIYMILEIVKDMKCSVLFTEDEEIGCVGATAFADTQYVKNLNVNYIIEFDRRGHNDAVFYDCDNPDFEDFVTSTGFFETDFGSCSDISVIAPASGVAAVNLSCGYYEEHRATEYVNFNQMEAVIKAAKDLIAIEVDEPFEYVETEYYDDYGYGRYFGRGDYNGYGYPYGSSRYGRYMQKYLICYQDYDGKEDGIIVEGVSEDDATLEFLKQNDTVPYGHIISVFGENQLEKMGLKF